MHLIVDSSVVLKWYVTEADSDLALRWRAENTFSAPDLLLIECRNALLNKVRRRVLTVSEAREIEDHFTSADFGIEIVPTQPFLSDAFQLALQLREAIYHCIYLATAISNSFILLTADERFFAKVADAQLAPGQLHLFSSPLP